MGSEQKYILSNPLAPKLSSLIIWSGFLCGKGHSSPAWLCRRPQFQPLASLVKSSQVDSDVQDQSLRDPGEERPVRRGSIDPHGSRIHASHVYFEGP